MERRRDNLQIVKGVQVNGATAYPARSLVFLSAGALTPVLTAGIVCYGWCPDVSHLSTDIPPTALYGQNHWCFDLQHAQLVMNITDGSGHVGQANGAPQLSAVSIGTQYGIYRDASTFMQMLNSADTTNKIFTVVALYPNQNLTDYNGLVIVELVPSTIQA